jgi:hypothetical protein
VPVPEPVLLAGIFQFPPSNPCRCAFSRAFFTLRNDHVVIEQCAPVGSNDTSCSGAYEQCGGQGWTGPGCCATGYECTADPVNPIYYRCRHDHPCLPRLTLIMFALFQRSPSPISCPSLLFWLLALFSVRSEPQRLHPDPGVLQRVLRPVRRRRQQRGALGRCPQQLLPRRCGPDCPDGAL